MNAEAITAVQRARRAIVYIRQSTERQVLENKESQRRQRDLVERVVDLGWPREQVVQIDEDQGKSGASTQERSGFRQMIAEAALGGVGIIIALEASRVSRSNHDWYHLLDICAVTGTLIADAEGIYDPRSHNDRLLLGLKATMSETELHTLKQRLVEAVRSKAARGEFRCRLPAGLEWDLADRIVKSPDEQVQSAIARVFERFDQLGVVHRVHCSLVDDGFQVPLLAGRGSTLKWIVPTYACLLRLLRNPFYAGAYAFGRRQVEQVLDDNQRPVKRTRELKDPAQWHTLIKDHHDGYISWEAYERNLLRIDANRNGERRLGAPREGTALLQGLVLCGICGRRMQLNYSSRTKLQRYICRAGQRQVGGRACQDFGGRRLEQRVAQLLLEALEPLGVEAMIEAASLHVDAGKKASAHWHQQLDRARYEVDLAKRQHNAVDPDNRLVARELERRYEQALASFDRVEAEAGQKIQAMERPLDAAEQAQLRGYAKDLPSLWQASSMRVQDKKRICRALIEHVVVTSPKTSKMMTADVHWISGEVSRIELERGHRGASCHVAEVELIELIRTLASELSDAQVARVLNTRGIVTPKGLTFTGNRVAVTRGNHGIACGPRVAKKGADIYSPDEAGKILGVNATTVIRWVEDGLLKGEQVATSAPWRVQVTEDDMRRLKATDAPPGWLTLKAAAIALRVSQPTVLQKLNSGKLEAVRVQVGRRSSWRIRVPPDLYDSQPTLFA
jgi:DNA invertase Pin-like site-specific DNA recombinase